MSTKKCVLFFIISTIGWYSTVVQCVGHRSDSSEEPALLIISYDGFHPDWINEKTTPNLFKFRHDGVSTPFMKNVFPTKTFVNHFTIATGLYPENHGVMASKLYDKKLGKVIGYSEQLYKFKENIKPIWTLNQLANKHSGYMMWGGAEFVYSKESNSLPTHKAGYDNTVNLTKRINQVMTWFTNETHPANLVMVYIEDPDFHSHIYGPDSERTKNKIKELDDLTGYIQGQLKIYHLQNRVNVIHLSDHGMSSVYRPNFINLTSFSDQSFQGLGSSPVLQIVANNGSDEKKIYADLQRAAEKHGHFKVYNCTNLPKRWRSTNEQRLGPTIAVADIKYAFEDMHDTGKIHRAVYNVTINDETVFGIHGYDNEEYSMRAMFMAKGPHFKTKKTLKSVNIVDLYNLFCSILKLECEPNDGSTDMSIWSNLLKEPSTLQVIKQKVRQSFTQLRSKPTK